MNDIPNSGGRSFDQQVTFLSVSDLERSTVFYTETLRLSPVLAQEDCRIFAVSNTAFVGVCLRPEAVDPTGVIVTLVTDDVDRWHDRLVAAGVACEKAPTLNERYNIYQALYRDPDGYLIEIQRFLEPEWPAV
jgi:catechol 2,3-dioxygenase-like lactoylglutathione lyase family enzyme